MVFDNKAADHPVDSGVSTAGWIMPVLLGISVALLTAGELGLGIGVSLYLGAHYLMLPFWLFAAAEAVVIAGCLVLGVFVAVRVIRVELLKVRGLPSENVPWELFPAKS